MTHPHFFGYGSLVNRATHDYGDARPARAIGWRRQWRHTTLRDVAFLTVTPAPGHTLDGLIAAVPNGDWAALDLREAAYDRHKIPSDQITHDHPQPITVQIYRTKPTHDAAASQRHPVLHSYLDTVVTGYYQVFGHQGVIDFFATTDGWDAPILDDRAAPLYPRTTPLAPDIRRLIDTMLDELNANRTKPL